MGLAEDNYPIAFCLALVVFFVTIPLFIRASVKKPGFSWGNVDILLPFVETRLKEAI